MAEFTATFTDGGSFQAVFTAQEAFGTEFDDVILVGELNYFDGDYEYTPTQEVQTIPIHGKTGREDITINPIPSNYGRVSYDGSRLRVE